MPAPDSADSLSTPELIILNAPVARPAVVLLSAVWTLAALLAIAAFATASSAVEPAQPMVAQASAVEPAKKQAPSSMLEVSAYAIAKDKLD